jgi:(p)ppGpp synthase/HD superfamily hydrolase
VPHPASCELPVERAALAFARERHAGQRRTSDGADFMAHLDEVAGLLRAAGHGEATIAAGLLHDVLEKTGATRDELEAWFGPRIAGLVAAMTENEAISAYEERKAEQRARVARHGPDALAVFAADKTAKVRELHDRVAGPEAAHKVDRRLGHYRACLDLLEAYAPDDVLTRWLRVELRPFAGR